MDFNIITFHRSINFGAALQAFALQMFIKKCGYSVGVFDYLKPTAKQSSNTFRSKVSTVLDCFINDENANQERKKCYNEFLQNYFNLNHDTNCNVFITGSDQVWNTGDSFDPMYFLQFLDESIYKASYAASMSKAEIQKGKETIFKKYLNDLDDISVRETHLKECIEQYTAKPIHVHLDPTLLHDKNFYLEFALPVKNIPDRFILVYILHIPKNGNSLLKWLKKETGAKIVLLDSTGKVGLFLKNDLVINNIGPQEFLWLFKNAESIVTTSFHGTCFSIIFEKEFYSIVNSDSPERIASLLSILGLNPVLESDKVFKRNNTIDWSRIRNIIRSEICSSEQYIRAIYEKSLMRSAKEFIGNVETIRSSCTGCAACEAVCPVSAITMVLNTQGFYEPKVTQERCIKCNKCLTNCPLNHKQTREPLKAFYGWHKDKEILYGSSSGGAFNAIASEIIQKKGIVVGAVYSDDLMDIVFKSTEDTSLSRMQKSKYTVSYSPGIYKIIRKHIEEGKTVLFCGTPCQCAGVKAVFGNENEQLITCDFVCGGMPSLLFYREHLKMLKDKFSSEINSVDFRPKKWGWGRCRMFVLFENGKKYIKMDFADSFFKLFNEKASVRVSCECCPYYHYHRSDITIADFWGYKMAGVKKHKEGMSMIICNTDKGLQLFSQIESFLKFDLPLECTSYTVREKIPRSEVLKAKKVYFDEALKVGFERAANNLYDTNEVHYYIDRILKKLHIK